MGYKRAARVAGYSPKKGPTNEQKNNPSKTAHTGMTVGSWLMAQINWPIGKGEIQNQDGVALYAELCRNSQELNFAISAVVF